MNIWDRLIALTILPQEGNLAQLRLVRELAGKLGLSAEEINKYEVTTEKDGTIKWNKDKDEELLIPFHDKEFELMRDQLTELDKKNKLEQKMFSLCEKFMGD